VGLLFVMTVLEFDRVAFNPVDLVLFNFIVAWWLGWSYSALSTR
jgi:hypothetical protein